MNTTIWPCRLQRLLMACAVIGVLGNSISSQAETNPFDQLLQQVRAQHAQELAQNDERVQSFKRNVAAQQQQLTDAKRRLAQLKKNNRRLSDSLDSNELKLAGTEEQLRLKSGDLGEMFGVVRQVAGEVQATLKQSLISVQYPERAGQLTELANSKALPNVDQLEDFWHLMLQESGETGQTRRFTAQVVQPDGRLEDQAVIRVGAFTALAAHQYLVFESDSRRLKVLPVQPPRRFVQAASEFTQAPSGLIPVMVDPTRGQLLQLLRLTPNLSQRLQQGGVIGYCILALGAIGLLLALVRYLVLSGINRRIGKQLANMTEPRPDNPLGRIVLAFENRRHPDFKAREAALEEAVAAEVPVLERWNGLIKLLAAVAPLLGLLGTVIGMILTFQSITLFGTSDPKLMAGGISTALVTTVLGLTVAIPLLFAHALVSARSRRLFDVVEHQSLGLIVREQSRAGA